jgi:hypothetical protein
MNKIAAGLVLLALALWGAVSWWWFLFDVLKGLVVVLLFLAGLLLVGLGVRGVGGAPVAKRAAR